jgi:hypothetical protein
VLSSEHAIFRRSKLCHGRRLMPKLPPTRELTGKKTWSRSWPTKAVAKHRRPKSNLCRHGQTHERGLGTPLLVLEGWIRNVGRKGKAKTGSRLDRTPPPVRRAVYPSRLLHATPCMSMPSVYVAGWSDEQARRRQVLDTPPRVLQPRRKTKDIPSHHAPVQPTSAPPSTIPTFIFENHSLFIALGSFQLSASAYLTRALSHTPTRLSSLLRCAT